jgi:hypothetical protein
VIVPFSGGSSLEANFAAPYGGISIDFMHMDHMLDFHPDEYDNEKPLTISILIDLVWMLLSNLLCHG